MKLTLSFYVVFYFRYNEEEHNCFEFVMAFVKRFDSFKPLAHRVQTRVDFTELYIAPTTIQAYKYIYLYRKIVENGFYIYNQSSNEILCTQYNSNNNNINNTYTIIIIVGNNNYVMFFDVPSIEIIFSTKQQKLNNSRKNIIITIIIEKKKPIVIIV